MRDTYAFLPLVGALSSTSSEPIDFIEEYSNTILHGWLKAWRINLAFFHYISNTSELVEDRSPRKGEMRLAPRPKPTPGSAP
jgi:hypothetical protein